LVDYFVLGDGFAAVEIGLEGAGAREVASQGDVDDGLGRGGVARDYSVVGFFDFAFLELFLEVGFGWFVFGEDDDPRGAAVETVSNQTVAFESGLGVVLPLAHAKHTRGFVEDEDVGVFVNRSRAVLLLPILPSRPNVFLGIFGKKLGISQVFFSKIAGKSRLPKIRRSKRPHTSNYNRLVPRDQGGGLGDSFAVYGDGAVFDEFLEGGAVEIGVLLY